MSLALALRHNRGSGFGDWFDDLYPQVGNDGIIRINSEPAYPGLPPNAERSTTWRHVDGLIVEANGSMYMLPLGVALPPGWGGVMSQMAKEQWVWSVGGTLLGPANLTDEERAWLNRANTPYAPGELDAIARQNRALDEQAKQANESPLETLLRKAREAAQAGGEGAATALKTLADNGDFFAKIALALGIGYGAVTIGLAVVAGVVGIAVLKK